MAIATPPGRGGVGIVRISGNAVPLIAAAVLGSCRGQGMLIMRGSSTQPARPSTKASPLYFAGPALHR